jgi:GNAT superfamily N-acetyltransferase
MGFADSITRLTDYYSRHGFGATIRRAALQVKRVLFASRFVVFNCDLNDQKLLTAAMPASLQVERVLDYSHLNATDLERLTSIGNTNAVIKRIKERFSKGATLWLVRSADIIAGYGWSLQADTIEPYFFSLAKEDFHLFDFHVFAEFRGKGLNPLLVRHILSFLAHQTGGHAFIECAEWNQPQLASLAKTPFHRLGMVRNSRWFGHVMTRWADGGPLETSLATGMKEKILVVGKREN